jgi:hypothetical protein
MDSHRRDHCYLVSSAMSKTDRTRNFLELNDCTPVKIPKQKSWILYFVGRASRYNHVKKNQLDAQFILSIFRQPLHVSGVSRPIIRGYNRMYTIGTYSF